LKYIGPFLKLNYLSTENIKNQLFHLAKESEKILIFYSNFGIVSDAEKPEFILKSYYDINTFRAFSPLLCIYKKGDVKLDNVDKKLCLDNSNFRKDILIWSNVFMTLTVIELSKYYKFLETKHQVSHSLSKTYLYVAENQLQFYLTYLRNNEGVFVDKKNMSDEHEFKFENKSKNYLFSDQALAMATFASYSTLCRSKDSQQYKDFSFDIFNMLVGYKESLYDLPYIEIMKICIGLNLFYDYTKNEDVLPLLLDLYDFSECSTDEDVSDKQSITDQCLFVINSMLLHEHINLTKYKDNANRTLKNIKKLYDKDKCMFIKGSSKKEININSTELILFLLSNLIVFDDPENTHCDKETVELYKHIIENLGLIGSFPNVPNLDNPERYKNFSLDSNDLLDEINFKLDTIGTPEATLLMPLFLKEITYNKKKESFSEPKTAFYSNQNTFFFFLFIYLFKPSFENSIDDEPRLPSHKSKKHGSKN
jgi:hypothetical protein